ncbi:MAG: ribonuclease P [Candidatus Thermoplasmatota archaeon]|nr:ribonuclease P [Candidatus Thermoplasmatota archaeon]MBS3790361.1 ribonuclease P [Candidatus Thermoplasmatota archaeon]
MGRKKNKNIAKKRIKKLFEEAKEAALEDELKRSDRYVELARKIGMRHNVTLDSKYKRRVCRNCYSYLHPGKTCKIRIKEGSLITKCLKCGTINRFGYKD